MPISKIKGSVISDSSIDSVRLDDGSIVSVDIADNAVSESKIVTGAVTETKLGTGAVTETKLGTGAVTETKLANGAVTETKLGTGAVTETKLANGAVTENKINNQSITADKIHPSVPLNNFRNLLINGDMNIAQRGFGVNAYSTASYVTVDRWLIRALDLSGEDFELSRPNEAPAGTGLSNSFKIKSNNIIPNFPSTHVAIEQRIEGQFLQQLLYGTPDAKSLTASFWVKTNKEGEYTLSLYSYNNGERHICSSYAISASEIDTWVYKTVTFAGDTDFALDNDNNESLRLWFLLQAGTDLSSGSQNTSWSTYSAGNVASDNQVVFGSEANNYWQITGVQLEEGSTPTPFEYRPYDVELLRCQRYYQQYPVFSSSFGAFQSYYGGNNAVCPQHNLITVMRDTPTPTIISPSIEYYSYSGVWTSTTLSIAARNNFYYDITCSTDGDGRGKLLRNGSSGNAIDPIALFSAEL